MPLSDTQKQERLDALTAGAHLANGGGGVDRWFDRRLQRFNENNPGLTSTFDPATATTADYGAAQGLWNRATYQSGGNRNSHGYGTDGEYVKPRPAVFRGRVKEQIAENAVDEGNRQLDEVYNPTWDRAQNSINEMMDQPLFDETLLHQTRSGIAQTIKGAEQDRLKRAAAALNLRGLDPSSPAGAAIAARTALEADTNLANSLRDFAMQSTQMEENSRMAELGLASNLVTSRMAATSALQGGNLDRLFQVSSDLDALLEGLRQQREYQAMVNAQAREAGKTNWTGMALQAGGMALGGYFGGAAGAQFGGALGGMVGGTGIQMPDMSGWAGSDPWSWRGSTTAAPTNSWASSLSQSGLGPKPGVSAFAGAG